MGVDHDFPRDPITLAAANPQGSRKRHPEAMLRIIQIEAAAVRFGLAVSSKKHQWRASGEHFTQPSARWGSLALSSLLVYFGDAFGFSKTFQC
jgi:hypothetical protein